MRSIRTNVILWAALHSVFSHQGRGSSRQRTATDTPRPAVATAFSKQHLHHTGEPGRGDAEYRWSRSREALSSVQSGSALPEARGILLGSILALVPVHATYSGRGGVQGALQEPLGSARMPDPEAVPAG